MGMSARPCTEDKLALEQKSRSPEVWAKFWQNSESNLMAKRPIAL